VSDTTGTVSALAAIRTFPPRTAKLAAVEILLADPESLQ
jgi:hypothetical protein